MENRARTSWISQLPTLATRRSPSRALGGAWGCHLRSPLVAARDAGKQFAPVLRSKCVAVRSAKGSFFNRRFYALAHFRPLIAWRGRRRHEFHMPRWLRLRRLPESEAGLSPWLGLARLADRVLRCLRRKGHRGRRTGRRCALRVVAPSSRGYRSPTGREPTAQNKKVRLRSLTLRFYWCRKRDSNSHAFKGGGF